MAVGVVSQLREFGETRRGWLGVRIQPVTDEIAESLGIKVAKGALVSGIIKGGPVDNGVIEVGDVIVKFDGRDIDESRELPLAVAESPVGKVVDVVIMRKGEEMTVKVTLGRLEEGEKLAEAEGTPPEAEGGPVATAADPRHDGRRTDRRGAHQVRHRGRRFGRGRHRSHARTPPRPSAASSPAT